jgi:NADH-quinone oxidoreductase subunit C
MDASAIVERLQGRFGASVISAELTAKDPWILVEAAAIADVCRYCRDDAELRCDALSNLSGVDYKAQDYIELVYHLYSYPFRHYVILKARTGRDDARLPTVEGVWKAANWLEREIFDLLGVTFIGHSDLRRLLMPEDWVGYPLRKDFVEPDEYHGISTRRESLLR